MELLHRICLIFMQVCSLLSIVINAMLLPLIYYRSGRGIGKYRFLLLAYCLVTMLFAMITASTVTVFSPTTEGWIMYATINLLPQVYGSWISVMYCCCYSLQLVVIVLSFIYRFFVMCHREQLKWFHDKKHLAVTICAAMSINLLWTGLTAIFLFPTEEMNVIFKQRVYELSGLDIRHVSYIAGVAWLNGEMVWEFFGVFSCRITICILSSCLIGFCAVRTVQKFRENTQASSHRVQMAVLERKLFYLLMFQTAIPLLLVFLPAVCGYAFGILRISSPQLTTIFSAALPLAQLVDPLLILLFIADYRRSLLLFINYSVLRRGMSSVAPNGLSKMSSGQSGNEAANVYAIKTSDRHSTCNL